MELEGSVTEAKVDLDWHCEISETFRQWVLRFWTDGMAFTVKFRQMDEVSDANQLLLELFERVIIILNLI